MIVPGISILKLYDKHKPIGRLEVVADKTSGLLHNCGWGYSWCKAITGSTRMARRAGVRQPNVAAKASTTEAVTNVVGSAADT